MKTVFRAAFFLIVLLALVTSGITTSLALDALQNNSEPPDPALLEDIENRMAAVRTLRSGFVQKKKLSLFEEELEIRGTLVIEKPDRFAWKVHSPVNYVLILDKDRLIQWDETAGIVSETDLAGNPMFEEVVAQVTGWFFGAYRERKTDYETFILQHDPLVLEFRPRKESPANAFMSRLAITFLPDRRYISEIFIEENGGDTTRLIFENTELNPTLDNSEWQVADGVH